MFRDLDGFQENSIFHKLAWDSGVWVRVFGVVAPPLPMAWVDECIQGGRLLRCRKPPYQSLVARNTDSVDRKLC